MRTVSSKSITMLQSFANDLGLIVQRRGAGESCYVIKKPGPISPAIFIASSMREAWAFLHGVEMRVAGRC
jgi:hypothetical protein